MGKLYFDKHRNMLNFRSGTGKIFAALFTALLCFSALTVTAAAATETKEITCSSTIDTYRTICPLPLNPERVALKYNLSHAPCVFGVNWGLEAENLWTSNGCSARFDVRYGDPIVEPEPIPQETPEEITAFRREA